MRSLALALSVGILFVGLIAPARAQEKTPARGEGSGDLKSREAVDTHYDKARDALQEEYAKRFEELEDQRIAALAALAARQDKDEAATTYRQIFHQAIARDQYEGAAKAADQLLKSDRGDRSLRALATFIKVVAEADRGDDDAALADLKAFLRRDDPSEKLDARTVFAVGGAFLQRLIGDGRYDSARKAATLLLGGSADPAVKEHFEARLARLDMLGQPAPPIAATDIDGETVRLADLKGKVVLINFWATWCQPCVSHTPELNALYDQYHARGFEILGVNVDGAREGHDDPAAVRSTVRRFLIDFNVPWINILNGSGKADFTQPYGVKEIPALFLVGRDGTMIQFEQTGEALDRSIQEALGKEKQADSSKEKQD